jgi:hypothetical protein
MSTTKHTLKYGGTPFNTDGTTVNLDVKDIKGTGSAACACGWFSESLDTGAARKEAFKAHKAEAEALDAAEADVSAGETATPEDATAEAEGSEDASETQADSSEVAEDDDPGTEVAYEGHGAAKSFWKALGVDASAAVAEVFGVTLKYRTKDHTVVLHGDEAQTVADMLPRLWAEAQPYFRDWKKSDKKYGAHDKRTKDGLHEAYAMELKFFQELGKGAAAAVSEGEPKKNGSAGYRAGVKLVENGGLDEVADDDLI